MFYTEKNSVSTAAEFTDYYVQQFAVCHDGKDLLYNYNRNSRGLVLAPLNKLHQETELCPEEYVGMSMNNSILYQDGKVYMLNFDRDLMCFALADTVRENKTLRYISSGYQGEAPLHARHVIQRIKHACFPDVTAHLIDRINHAEVKVAILRQHL